MNSKNIIEYFEKKIKRKLDDDEGIMYGKSNKKVVKILLCWMISEKAIKEANKNSCSHIITHESLFYPYNTDLRKKENKEYLKWDINKKRIALLNEYNITVIRIHGTLDKIIILDQFAKSLGFTNCIKEDGFVRIYKIKPISINILIETVKKKLKLEHIRAAIPDGYNKKIEKIGLPWGGLGLFVNVDFQQKLINEGIDVMIGGESDSYGMIFSKEIGIPFVETGHEISENIGIAKFSNILEKEIGRKVIYYENKSCFTII